MTDMRSHRLLLHLLDLNGLLLSLLVLLLLLHHDGRLGRGRGRGLLSHLLGDRLGLRGLGGGADDGGGLVDDLRLNRLILQKKVDKLGDMAMLVQFYTCISRENLK